MLVLKRSQYQRVMIGEPPNQTIIEVVSHHTVKLGITAPDGVPIVREELIGQHINHVRKSAGE